jgi:hypothetical protein
LNVLGKRAQRTATDFAKHLMLMLGPDCFGDDPLADHPPPVENMPIWLQKRQDPPGGGSCQ